MKFHNICRRGSKLKYNRNCFFLVTKSILFYLYQWKWSTNKISFIHSSRSSIDTNWQNGVVKHLGQNTDRWTIHNIHTHLIASKPHFFTFHKHFSRFKPYLKLIRKSNICFARCHKKIRIIGWNKYETF